MKLSRRTLLVGSAAASAFAFTRISAPAHAAAPKAAGQVAGAYRISVGEIEVTALLDGFLEPGLEIMNNADKDVAEKLLAESFQDTVRLDVNAYLANAGGKLVLFDAGARDTLGPTLGTLPASLKAAGVTPDQIDVLAVTHMHPDHIGGLIGKDGGAVFKNAVMHVSETDYKFWTSDEVLANAEGNFRSFLELARAVAAAYKERTQTFSGEGEVAPGITPVALPGHTPGHVGYRVSSGKDQLLIWGDIVHAPDLQFDQPDWTVRFDADPDMAAKSRMKILDEVAADRLQIAGMHLWYPGFGHVSRKGGKAYAFHPSRWQHKV